MLDLCVSNKYLTGPFNQLKIFLKIRSHAYLVVGRNGSMRRPRVTKFWKWLGHSRAKKIVSSYNVTFLQKIKEIQSVYDLCNFRDISSCFTKIHSQTLKVGQKESQMVWTPSPIAYGLSHPWLKGVSYTHIPLITLRSYMAFWSKIFYKVVAIGRNKSWVASGR